MTLANTHTHCSVAGPIIFFIFRFLLFEIERAITINKSATFKLEKICCFSTAPLLLFRMIIQTNIDFLKGINIAVFSHSLIIGQASGLNLHLQFHVHSF